MYTLSRTACSPRHHLHNISRPRKPSLAATMHLLALLTLLPLTLAHQSPLAAIDATGLTVNSIPYSTRVHWMRKANEALSLLSSPCPFAAFGTVIVNHTAVTPDGLGKLVCIGINENSKTGNPTLHGKLVSSYLSSPSSRMVE